MGKGKKIRKALTVSVWNGFPVECSQERKHTPLSLLVVYTTNPFICTYVRAYMKKRNASPAVNNMIIYPDLLICLSICGGVYSFVFKCLQVYQIWVSGVKGSANGLTNSENRHADQSMFAKTIRIYSI